ncbi:MAG: radical SAM protein [Candidatus Omnitrophota bacterium]|nr:radical SAM protein [Candidatus Omnitrophota bacterium]
MKKKVRPGSLKGNWSMNDDIVFYQSSPIINLGVVSLSTHLKQAGFKSSVIIESLERDPIQAIRELNPRSIGFSVFSVEHSNLIRAVKRIHSVFPDIPIIVGGTHAILYPEKILKDTLATLVCHSDGEAVLVNILKKLIKSSTPDWSSVEGVAYKDASGRIQVNERALLFQYRDDVVEERTIYSERYPGLGKDEEPPFIATRGCPYSCSFCYNSYLRKVVQEKGQFLRQKSVGNLINEISAYVKKNNNVKIVSFVDDLFTFNGEWLTRFLLEYKAKINIPFICTSRANEMNEGTAEKLAKGGCRTVIIGVESGNEDIRNRVLEKRITDEQVIRCGKILRKFNIRVRSTNMFCLPDETVKDALRTVELNIEAEIPLAFSALFMPFPDTKIFEYCKEKQLVGDNYSLENLPRSCFKTSILRVPDKQKIVNIHYLCFFFVRYPWAYRAFKQIIYIQCLKSLFYFSYILGNIIRHKEERGFGWVATIKFVLRVRNAV